MTDAVVTWLPVRVQPGYTDTAALNDIHALLTTNTGDSQALLADLGLVLPGQGARWRLSAISTPPSPRPKLGGQSSASPRTAPRVTIRQEPAGPGLQIHITTSGSGGDVAVTLDGRMCQPSPPSGSAA